MPGITPLPTPPSRSDPTNFAARGDAFLAALVTFVAEANALAAAMGVLGTAAPAFLVNVGTPIVNQTGDGTLYDIVFDTEIFDANANVAGGAFTAPIAGKYQFNLTLNLSGLLSGHTQMYAQLTTSNRNYLLFNLDPHNIIVGDAVTISGGMLADMDAGDTAVVRVYVGGATKVVDIGVGSFFSGHIAT